MNSVNEIKIGNVYTFDSEEFVCFDDRIVG